jgi:hypothetical protein
MGVFKTTEYGREATPLLTSFVAPGVAMAVSESIDAKTETTTFDLKS